jgi:hypothetical protein
MRLLSSIVYSPLSVQSSLPLRKLQLSLNQIYCSYIVCLYLIFWNRLIATPPFTLQVPQMSCYFLHFSFDWSMEIMPPLKPDSFASLPLLYRRLCCRHRGVPDIDLLDWSPIYAAMLTSQ